MIENEVTIEILRGIRSDIQELRGDVRGMADQIQQTNARLDQTNARLDQTNARLDQTNERLDRNNERLDRLAEGQIRVATMLSDRISAVESEVHDLTLEVRALNQRIDHVFVGPLGQSVRDHEQRITRIEQRLES